MRIFLFLHSLKSWKHDLKNKFLMLLRNKYHSSIVHIYILIYLPRHTKEKLVLKGQIKT